MVLLFCVWGARSHVERAGLTHCPPRDDLELLILLSLSPYAPTPGYVSLFLEIQLKGEIVIYSEEHTVSYTFLVWISVLEFASFHLIAATHSPSS